jgi:CBS domain-containing protein
VKVGDSGDDEAREVGVMQVRDGMTTKVLSIGPDHSLREAARLMSQRGAGAAVVVDPDTDGIGILTERDVLDAVGGSQDPTRETASAHLTMDVVFARPDWTLEQAAEAMLHGGFRHLVVLDGQDIAGLLSMRDIVRCWTSERTAG